MSSLVVLGLVAVAACGSDSESADEPTTQPSSASTSAATSTTTPESTTIPLTTELVTSIVSTTLLETTVPTTEPATTVEVTTTEAPATTGAPPTTGATSVPPTTPPGPTTGRFLTVGPFGTVGMWDADAGGVWVDDIEDPGDIPVAPGDTFTVFSRDGLEGSSTVTGVDLVCEFSESYGPILDPALGFDFEGVPSPLAINAPWDIQPRVAEVLDPASPEWIAPIQQQLAELELPGAPVRVIEAVRTDLEGNGTMETVLIAQNPEIEPMVAPPAGYYSIVVVLRPDGPEVLTSLLTNAVYLEDQEFPSFVDFRLQSFSDLNGDGTMEVIIDYVLWEGAGTYVYEVGEGTDPELVIAGGCGS